MINPKEAFNAIHEVFSQNENFDDFVLAAAEYIASRGALKNPDNKTRYLKFAEDIANFREVEESIKFWNESNSK